MDNINSYLKDQKTGGFWISMHSNPSNET